MQTPNNDITQYEQLPLAKPNVSMAPLSFAGSLKS